MAIKHNYDTLAHEDQANGLYDEVDADQAPFADLDDDTPDAIGLLRQRMGIGENELSDVTIASSLAAIAAKGDPRARWLAAFSTPLGKWLAKRGTDLNTALNIMMTLAPKSS